eukprot:1182694-Prorocentrum_minimum.AAC.2
MTAGEERLPLECRADGSPAGVDLVPADPRTRQKLERKRRREEKSVYGASRASARGVDSAKGALGQSASRGKLLAAQATKTKPTETKSSERKIKPSERKMSTSTSFGWGEEDTGVSRMHAGRADACRQPRGGEAAAANGKRGCSSVAPGAEPLLLSAPPRPQVSTLGSDLGILGGGEPTGGIGSGLVHRVERDMRGGVGGAGAGGSSVDKRSEPAAMAAMAELRTCVCGSQLSAGFRFCPNCGKPNQM